MKNRLIIILSLFVLSACNDDLLDKQPVTTLNPGTFWQNGDEAEMAVNALYTFLPDISQIDFDNRTEISVQPYTGGNDLVNGQIQVTSGEVLGWWRSHYRALAAANRFIEQVALVPTQEIDPELLTRLKAEARFIRAVSYTFLTNYFGNVPFVTHELTPSEAAAITRTERAEILAFIESELDEIAGQLPVEYTGDDIGRITRGAALAWKARAMLWSKQYQKAADAAKAVIDLGQYQLHNSYAELFSYDAEYQNNEVILEYIYTPATGHDFMRRAAPYGVTRQTSFMSFNPTAALVDAYETINGLAPADDPAFDPEDPYRNRDPRLQATVWLPLFQAGSYADMLWGTSVPHDVRPGSKTRDEVFSIRGNQTGFLLKKYTNEEDMATITNSSQNYIILRYADVLLMYAEAKIELGQIDPSVVEAIDAVRGRVNLPSLADKGVDIADQAAMREAVRHERLIELAMEGWRFYDIRRWDVAQDLLAGSSPAPGMTYRDINTGERLTIQWTGVNWNYQKMNEDHTYPVPWDEYNMNPNLLPQNEGW